MGARCGKHHLEQPGEDSLEFGEEPGWIQALLPGIVGILGAGIGIGTWQGRGLGWALGFLGIIELGKGQG